MYSRLIQVIVLSLLRPTDDSETFDTVVSGFTPTFTFDPLTGRIWIGKPSYSDSGVITRWDIYFTDKWSSKLKAHSQVKTNHLPADQKDLRIIVSTVKRTVSIELENKQSSRLELIDASGKLLQSFLFDGGPIELDMTHFASGAYFVTVKAAGLNHVGKFILP
jgi:hypothetical protein